MEANKYNGWTNYETWAVALWIDNEESSYHYWRDQVRACAENAPRMRQVQDGVWTTEEAIRFSLADNLRDAFDEGSPLAGQCSVYSDLLQAALDSVEWLEISRHLCTDVLDSD